MEPSWPTSLYSHIFLPVASTRKKFFLVYASFLNTCVYFNWNPHEGANQLIWHLVDEFVAIKFQLVAKQMLHDLVVFT